MDNFIWQKKIVMLRVAGGAFWVGVWLVAGFCRGPVCAFFHSDGAVACGAPGLSNVVVYGRGVAGWCCGEFLKITGKATCRQLFESGL